MEPTFAFDFVTPHIPTWEKFLAPYKGKPHVRFLEVGSFEGCSACWMLRNILTHETSTITCIDPFIWLPEALAYFKKFGEFCSAEELQARFEQNIQAVGGEKKTTLLKGRSENMLRSLSAASFDMIYIDGGHGARNVLSDLVLSWNLLKMHGIMIMDDYQLKSFPEDKRKDPRLGIDAFLRVFAGEYEVLHSAWQVILRKIQLPEALWSEESHYDGVPQKNQACAPA